ncbi:Small-conductance mechanosensitive channel [Kluyvera cryocrescens]|uniref:Small-conductance mechanosensitive channel n=1 Tax=Kluyvera cryocrescens TaxID=580 RepID=A0A485B2I9_KLUCR|nr:Small-conductance mechanosensitive channel [Kluyvera cryocrescens]
MEDLNVVDSINGAGSWLVRNQELLLSYAVNIVAAIAIIIVGMIAARIVSNTVNRLMLARKIDATVADFLSALVRYAVIAFTLIAALGRRGRADGVGYRRTGCRRFGRWFGATRVAFQPGCGRAAGYVPSIPCR